MPPPSPVDFATVMGVLRLAHKYDVQYLFRRALSHLDSMYPTDFSEFMDVNIGDADHHVDFPSGIGTDLIVLRAASELGATWLLPTAFYSVCTYSVREILGSGDLWSALGPHEQHTCLLAQPQMMRATALIHAFLQDLPNDPPCSTPEDCEAAVFDARDILLDWSRGGDRDVDPMRGWVFDDAEAQLCPFCSTYGEGEYEAAQREFWNRMPASLGSLAGKSCRRCDGM